jgi:hypothetical protein
MGERFAFLHGTEYDISHSFTNSLVSPTTSPTPHKPMGWCVVAWPPAFLAATSHDDHLASETICRQTARAESWPTQRLFLAPMVSGI